jgi:hypothetical protein
MHRVNKSRLNSLFMEQFKIGDFVRRCETDEEEQYELILSFDLGDSPSPR